MFRETIRDAWVNFDAAVPTSLVDAARLGMMMAALLRSLAIAIREDLTVLFDHKSAKDEVGRPIKLIVSALSYLDGVAVRASRFDGPPGR